VCLVPTFRCCPVQVFEDLYDYMKSLDTILALNPAVIYPAHGPVVNDPVTHVNGYISHRNQREAQILTTLRENANAYLTALDIVKCVYKVWRWWPFCLVYFGVNGLTDKCIIMSYINAHVD